MASPGPDSGQNVACGHGHLEGPETAQKCEALWMLRIPGRGVNVGGGAPLPQPQLPAPRPSASCLSGQEPGAFQEYCPREEGPGSPLSPGWPQMASGPSSSPKMAAGLRTAFPGPDQFSEQGSQIGLHFLS